MKCNPKLWERKRTGRESEPNLPETKERKTRHTSLILKFQCKMFCLDFSVCCSGFAAKLLHCCATISMLNAKEINCPGLMKTKM